MLNPHDNCYACHCKFPWNPYTSSSSPWQELCLLFPSLLLRFTFGITSPVIKQNHPNYKFPLSPVSFVPQAFRAPKRFPQKSQITPHFKANRGLKMHHREKKRTSAQRALMSAPKCQNIVQPIKLCLSLHKGIKRKGMNVLQSALNFISCRNRHQSLIKY